MQSDLIFAPLIRVSTEAQAKRGESLETQRAQLEYIIDSFGGTVYKWYAGPEHATPEQERKNLDELLHDAQMKKFNAVIVCDTSRWSRDNKRNEEDLKILRENHVRFFVGFSEYDLFNPEHEFMLTISVATARLQAKGQTWKSIVNRIRRAQKGWPTCGKNPYGRTYDKQKGVWIIDPRKKELLEQIAETYLREDISYAKLGARYGMNGPNLRKLLAERSGTKWGIRFRSKPLNIDQSVDIEVPALLSAETIKKIKEKSIARRTYVHGSQKYDYLLSRIIFDAKTGYALTGTPNSKGKRYYKPYKGSLANRYMINAEIIESAVIDGLSELVNNSISFRKAVFNGNALGDVADDLKKKKHKLASEIKSEKEKISRLMLTIENLGDENLETFIGQAKQRIINIEKKIRDLQFQYDILTSKLNTLPDLEEIENRRMRIKADLAERVRSSYLTSSGPLSSLPFSEKRKFVLLFFGGLDENGKKYGVYIKKLQGKPRRYQLEAYGKVGLLFGSISERNVVVSSWNEKNTEDDSVIKRTVDMIFDNDPDLKMKADMSGQRHAHYRIRLHQ